MVKSETIETLRAIAITLVIAFHITNDPELDGSRESYEFLVYLFQNLRLPLFTIISGYLYACRPAGYGKLKLFFTGKARRIFLPLICVSFIEYTVLALAPGINNPENLSEIWKLVFFPYEQYWFLQAILVIFIFVAILDLFELLGSFQKYLVMTAIMCVNASVIGYFGFDLSFFSIGGATYLVPFFLVGLGLKRYSNYLLSKKAALFSGFFTFALLLLQCIAWNTEMEDLFSKRALLGQAVGAVAGIFLFNVKPTFKPLAWLGGYAYTIYLYQAFGAGLGRRVFEELGQEHAHLYFIAVIATTLFAGVAVELVVKRIPYVRTALLGLK